jgi:hypothetical protein
LREEKNLKDSSTWKRRNLQVSLNVFWLKKQIQESRSPALVPHPRWISRTAAARGAVPAAGTDIPGFFSFTIKMHTIA